MKPINKFVNRILLGDCVQVMGQMPSETIDLVCTDPPYVCRYQSRDGRTVTNDDRDAWLEPAFTQMYRVSKPDRFVVSFYGWNRVDRFVSVHLGYRATRRDTCPVRCQQGWEARTEQVARRALPHRQL